VTKCRAELRDHLLLVHVDEGRCGIHRWTNSYPLAATEWKQISFLVVRELRMPAAAWMFEVRAEGREAVDMAEHSIASPAAPPPRASHGRLAGLGVIQQGTKSSRVGAGLRRPRPRHRARRSPEALAGEAAVALEKAGHRVMTSPLAARSRVVAGQSCATLLRICGTYCVAGGLWSGRLDAKPLAILIHAAMKAFGEGAPIGSKVLAARRMILYVDCSVMLRTVKGER